jgi:hypothetical protein
MDAGYGVWFGCTTCGFEYDSTELGMKPHRMQYGALRGIDGNCNLLEGPRVPPPHTPRRTTPRADQNPSD